MLAWNDNYEKKALYMYLDFPLAHFTYMEGRDGIEGDVQSDQFRPRVNERWQLLDGVVTHVDSLEALEEINWLWNWMTYSVTIIICTEEAY